MLSEEELLRRTRRRAWWMKVARDLRGLSQAGVATALGLSANSANLVGLWERGVNEPSLRQLAQLAALYEVPFSLFTDPPETDEERFWKLVGEQPPAAAIEVQPPKRARRSA